MGTWEVIHSALQMPLSLRWACGAEALIIAWSSINRHPGQILRQSLYRKLKICFTFSESKCATTNNILQQVIIYFLTSFRSRDVSWQVVTSSRLCWLFPYMHSPWRPTTKGMPAPSPKSLAMNLRFPKGPFPSQQTRSWPSSLGTSRDAHGSTDFHASPSTNAPSSLLLESTFFLARASYI